MPSANDLAILSQHSQTYHLRLDLLDTDFIKIGEVSGIATALTYSMSADSDIRANASLTMHVGDPSYLADSFSNVWLNRLVRLNYGLEDTAGNIAWYLWGSMLMNENSYTYDEKTQELSLTLVDMMAALTEIRGRQIGGYGILIPEGNNARNAIISTVAMFSPFKRYNVPELPDTIPYDLEFSATSYPYTVIKGILSLFPTYEMFYSTDGVFTVREIPTGIGDEVFLDETVLDPLIISERKTSRFSDVRNTTELMGMSLESDYTAMSCTTTGNRYDIFIMNTFEVLEDGMRYGFTPDTTSVVGQTLKIQNTAEIAIYQQTGAGAETPIAAGAMQAGIPYCIKYTAGKFYLQGELDIHVIVQEVQTALTPEEQQTFKEANDCRNVQWIVNPSSPFAADVIGDIRQVLQDGEYSEITTTNLAFERAKYENWQKTRLTNSVDITTVLIPWLEVNKKIRYHSPLLGKLVGDDLYIKDDGVLVSAEPMPNALFSLEIVNGQLIYTKNAMDWQYIVPDFFIDDDGNLVMDTSASSTTLMIQQINFDIDGFTTSISATQFYPYYPF